MFILLVIVFSSFSLGLLMSQRYLVKKPYIRISRDYDMLYHEYLHLCKHYKGDLSFRDFLIIKYDLWGSPLRYTDKLILFGFVNNRLQVLAMLNKEENKNGTR